MRAYINWRVCLPADACARTIEPSPRFSWHFDARWRSPAMAAIRCSAIALYSGLMSMPLGAMASLGMNCDSF